jgi:hypothetical protein
MSNGFYNYFRHWQRLGVWQEILIFSIEVMVILLMAENSVSRTIGLNPST